jgi:transcriptional regulator with XRE-family HTH domain
MEDMEKGWSELGEVIRRRRQAKRLTQEPLAELAGSHWTYISEIENGRRNPGVDVLRRIASGLETPLSKLIEEAER